MNAEGVVWMQESVTRTNRSCGGAKILRGPCRLPSERKERQADGEEGAMLQERDVI